MTLKDQRVRNRIEFAGPDSEEVIDVLTRLESGPTHFSRGMVWWLTRGKMRAATTPANVSHNGRPHPELPLLRPDRSRLGCLTVEASAADNRGGLVNWITRLTRI